MTKQVGKFHLINERIYWNLRILHYNWEESVPQIIEQALNSWLTQIGQRTFDYWQEQPEELKELMLKAYKFPQIRRTEKLDGKLKSISVTKKTGLTLKIYSALLRLNMVTILETALISFLKENNQFFETTIAIQEADSFQSSELDRITNLVDKRRAYPVDQEGHKDYDQMGQELIAAGLWPEGVNMTDEEIESAYRAMKQEQTPVQDETQTNSIIKEAEERINTLNRLMKPQTS